jgi:hypothetical protein
MTGGASASRERIGQNRHMVELALTAQRRSELAALLEDKQRLETEYPRVAEYLNTGPMLPGTGDDQADAAFDIRFLHYMTGGISASANPYWDIVAPTVHEYGGRRVVNGGRPDGSARLAFAQTILQATYAYAIPSPQTIGWMSSFCAGLPIVELGAGRGYWAAQLSGAGLVVDAYDLQPPDRAQNPSFLPAAGQTRMWHQVGGLHEFTERLGDRSGFVLFLCWPPGWGNTMASDALAKFEEAGGGRVIYVGEPKGGMAGSDAFFDALSARWKLESVDSQHVAWWNLADVAQGWVRR